MKSITVDMDQHFSFWPIDLSKSAALRPSLTNSIVNQKVIISVTDEWWDEYTRCNARYTALHQQLETMYRLQQGLHADETELGNDVSLTPPPSPSLAEYLASEFVVAQEWLDGDAYYRATVCATIDRLVDDAALPSTVGYLQALILSNIRRHQSYASVYAAAALAMCVSDMKKAGFTADTQLRPVIKEGLASVKYATLLYTDVKMKNRPIPMAIKRGLRDALVLFPVEDATNATIPPGCRSVAELYQYVHLRAAPNL